MAAKRPSSSAAGKLTPRDLERALQAQEEMGSLLGKVLVQLGLVSELDVVTTLAEFKLKMPQLAIPVRLLVCGRAQTPSVDAVLALFERSVVLARLAA